MKILLWVLQIVLSFWNIVGGIFTVRNYDKVGAAHALSALPGPVWIALAVLQILLAVGLVIPGAHFRKLNSVAAAGLGALSLLGIALYSQYHGFPGMLWGVVPALVAAFVAYKRWPASKA